MKYAIKLLKQNEQITLEELSKLVKKKKRLGMYIITFTLWRCTQTALSVTLWRPTRLVSPVTDSSCCPRMTQAATPSCCPASRCTHSTTATLWWSFCGGTACGWSFYRRFCRRTEACDFQEHNFMFLKISWLIYNLKIEIINISYWKKIEKKKLYKYNTIYYLRVAII